MKVIIIGGGASGLTAAIYSAKQKNETIILEKNKVCGKKIAVTGNGKCNFFNDDFSILKYHSNNLDLLKPFINEENKKKVLDFIKSIGVEYYQKDGYYYPLSNQATAIQNALIKEALEQGVKIKYEEEVIDIKKDKQFEIKTTNNVYFADKVIIAAGSKACPKTGSDGSLYPILKKLGHAIVPVVPALVQLKTKEQYKDLTGVRTNAVLTLLENNKKVAQVTGELQLTNYGISGICTFNLSSIVSRGLLENKKEEIIINFIPTINNFSEYMKSRENNLKNRSISDILDGLLNYKIVNQILKITKIKNETHWSSLNISQQKYLETLLTSFKFEITGTNDFENAQICSGGVSLKDINSSFESKIVKGLYIIGEILDVDGECGGYNLGFAFISGMISGKGDLDD